MAALVVQSRFAGLKIEDDDHPQAQTPNESQKAKKNKTNTAKKIEPPKKTKNNGTNNKSQSASKKRKVKQGQASDNQWELWKRKDEQLVNGNFECELQQAIILSKLDYEEKKDTYKQFQKEADTEKKVMFEKKENTRTSNKKQKKKTVMSLEQFNEMVTGWEENKVAPEEETATIGEINNSDMNTDLFERIKDETKNELIQDKINERMKNSQTTDGFITTVQFAFMVEKKDEEIAALQDEVASLKQELHTVKSRNKKLCGILGQGEMKDKAEVLVEVERLRAVQAELTAEIASLHSDLERERSKNTDPRSKDKKYNTKKKNIKYDLSSEAIPVKDSSAMN